MRKCVLFADSQFGRCRVLCGFYFCFGVSVKNNDCGVNCHVGFYKFDSIRMKHGTLVREEHMVCIFLVKARKCSTRNNGARGVVEIAIQQEM